STCRVPTTLAWWYSRYGPQAPALAALWKTASQPSAAANSASRLARSPRTRPTPIADSGVLAAIEAHHLVAAFAQATTQRLPQEPAATGDQDLQVDSSSLRAAQDASCSRPILALWRMSTGKPGCRITRSMPLVCGCVAPSARSSPATIGQSFSGTPGLSSTHSTGCFAPATPTPTSAVRRTLGWVLNTGSTCSVYSGPPRVSTRCVLRPQNHSRPFSSR